MKYQLVLIAIFNCLVINLSAQNKDKPNLVLFMADDCSYYDLGSYGSVDSKTPRIDKFASEGIKFTKAYQAAPMCSPTRHNLYTGLWPVKSGAYPNHTMANDGTLSIIHHLKSAGYKVALIGKSHVKPESVFPWDFYSPLAKSNELNFADIDAFIKTCTKDKQPFCLFVMSNQPHAPWNKGNPEMFNPEKIALPPFYVDTKKTREEFRNYLAEVNYMDNEFGQVLDKIDQYKIKDKTVVVYLSEQGNSFPFSKWTCYDVGVRSACLVRWPGKIQPGIVSDALVEFVDITPTFVEIAGAKPQSKMDGQSFLPVLLGTKKEHKQYTFSLQTTRGIINGSEHFGIRSVADKKYRYILNLSPDMTFKNAETKGGTFQEWLNLAETDPNAKAITYRYQHRPVIELYDLENDKYCLTNIAYEPESKSVVKRMDNVLKEWMASCGDKGQETEMEALQHMPRKMKGEKDEE